jgi:diguanylate cyclase (GGDEF)-like protein
MVPALSPHTILLFISTIITGFLTWLVWKKRREIGGMQLLFVQIALFIWVFFAGLQDLVAEITHKILFVKLSFFGVISIPVFLLLFALYFTHHSSGVNPARTVLLSGFPLVTLVLALTNERHGLIWRSVEYINTAFGNNLTFNFGAVFWWFLGYAYVCVLIAMLLVLHTALKFRYIFRKQLWILLAGLVLALLLNIIYTFELLQSIQGFDMTPFSLTIFSMVMTWSFYKLRFFDLSPIGRDVLVDNIQSSLLVLDEELRIVDLNKPMLQLINDFFEKERNQTRQKHYGQSAKIIFANWPEFVAVIENINNQVVEVNHQNGGQKAIYEVRVSALGGAGKNAGWLIFLMDITDRIKMIETEKRTRQVAEALQETAMVINSSLEVEQTLNLALEMIGRVISYDTANIALLKKDEVVIEYIRGFPNPLEVQGMHIPLEGSPNQQALIHRHPVMYPDVQAVFPRYREHPHNVVHSLLCIPLYAKEEVLGFLTLDSRRLNNFSYEDLGVSAAFAAQVAISLQNARLYSAVNRRLTEQSILNEVIHIATANLDKLQFIHSVEKQIQRFIPSPVILFAEHEPDQASWSFVELNAAPYLNLPKTYNLSEGLTGYVIDSGKPLFLNSQQDLNQFLKEQSRENIGPLPRGFMGAPMVIKEKVIGALVTQNLDEDGFFNLEDFGLFSTIASQVAVGFENVRLFSRLDIFAKTDALTGLFNRRYFHQLSESAFEQAIRQRTPLAVIMLDIDHFKNINDTFGHLIGDLVLQKVAGACRAALRETDLIGRYGGEEFAIILPGTQINEAKTIAERIRQSIEMMEISTSIGEVSTTASLGVVTIYHSGLSSMEKMLDASDKALYQAKDRGRNCVRVYQEK